MPTAHYSLPTTHLPTAYCPLPHCPLPTAPLPTCPLPTCPLPTPHCTTPHSPPAHSPLITHHSPLRVAASTLFFHRLLPALGWRVLAPRPILYAASRPVRDVSIRPIRPIRPMRPIRPIGTMAICFAFYSSLGVCGYLLFGEPCCVLLGTTEYY